MWVGVFYNVESLWKTAPQDTKTMEDPKEKNRYEKMKEAMKAKKEAMKAKYEALRSASMAKILARIPDTVPVKIWGILAKTKWSAEAILASWEVRENPEIQASESRLFSMRIARAENMKNIIKVPNTSQASDTPQNKEISQTSNTPKNSEASEGMLLENQAIKVEEKRTKKSNTAKKIWNSIQAKLGIKKEKVNAAREAEYLPWVEAVLDDAKIAPKDKIAIIVRYSQSLIDTSPVTPDTKTDESKTKNLPTETVTWEMPESQSKTTDKPTLEIKKEITTPEKLTEIDLTKSLSEWELKDIWSQIIKEWDVSAWLSEHARDSEDLQKEERSYEALVTDQMITEALRDEEIHFRELHDLSPVEKEDNLDAEFRWELADMRQSLKGEVGNEINIPDVLLDETNGYYFRDEYGNVWSTWNTDKEDMKDLLEFYTQFSTPPLDHLRSRGHVFLEWLYHRLGKKWTQESWWSDAMSPKEMRRYILLALAKNAYPKKQEIQNIQALNIKEWWSDQAYINMIKPLFVEWYQGKPSETLARLKNMWDDSLLTSSGDFRMNKFLSLF